MNNWQVIFDVICIVFAVVGFYYAYKLWSALGKHGITIWLMCAMIWSIFLRVINLLKDFNVNWSWFSYKSQLATPLYLFLTIGLCGLYYQVTNKLEGNGHKNVWAWLWRFITRKKE